MWENLIIGGSGFLNLTRLDRLYTYPDAFNLSAWKANFNFLNIRLKNTLGNFSHVRSNPTTLLGKTSTVDNTSGNAGFTRYCTNSRHSLTPLEKTCEATRPRDNGKTFLNFHLAADSDITTAMIKALENRFSRIGQCAGKSEPVITRLMKDALSQKGLISLAAGFTSNITLPVEKVQKAVSQIANALPPGDWLQYGMNQGQPALRQEVLRWLQSYCGESGLGLNPEHVLITNGSQQALYLSTQLFCNPGDQVLVEEPSYFVMLELLRGLDIFPVPIPYRSDGQWDISKLRQLLNADSASRLKMIYLMGVFANPSTRCIREEDKLALAEILHRLPHPIPVIEDMAYRELFFEQPYPAKSMLALPQWQDLPVLYAGTFTKPFATGLKTGYAVTRSEQWLSGIARIKGHQDFGTAQFNQAILTEILRSGAYREHLKIVRPDYQQKMLKMHSCLESLGLRKTGWDWEVPSGGLLMWLKGPDGVDTGIDSPLWKSAIKEGVIYVPGNLCFTGNKAKNYMRLSFGAVPSEEIEEGCQRLATAISQQKTRRGVPENYHRRANRVT